MRSAVLAAVLTLASLAPAAAVPHDLDRWIAVRSQSFTLLTDADPARGVELARNLELFRGAFARLSPALELRSAVPTTFLAFRDRESYAPYKSHPDGGGGALLGQFLIHPDRNFLTFDASARPVSAAAGGGFAVIYHEFVHYLVAHNFHRVPRWFHEGLAEYYSTFAIEDGRIHVGRPVERHLRWLRFDNREAKERSLSHDFSLRALLGDAGHHGSRAGGFYAMSWALVHHLLSGGPERLDRMADFLLLLRDGEDPDRAFESAFELRLDDLEETLRAYAYRQEGALATLEPVAAFPVASFDVEEVGAPPASSVAPLAPPDTLFHLGDLELRLGRLESAERHFQAALDHTLDHAEALAGLAWIRDLASRFAEADVLFQDALSVGSSDPLTYLRYGRHLLARIQPDAGADLAAAGRADTERTDEEPNDDERAGGERAASAEELAAGARAAFATAIRLDPEFAEARALYGYAHVFGEIDPGPGIEALERARRQLPDRHDLTLSLIQLQLKKKGFEHARRLLEGELRGAADERTVLRAEEEIERARLLHAASEALERGNAEAALSLFDQAIAATSDQDLRDRMAARLSALEERYGAR